MSREASRCGGERCSGSKVGLPVQSTTHEAILAQSWSAAGKESVRVLLRESDGQLEDVGGGLVDGLGLDAHRGMVYGVEHAPVVLKELDGGPFERVPWDTRRPAVQDDLVSQDHLLDDLATTEPWSLRKGDDRDSILAVEKSRNHPVDLEPSTPGRLG